MTRRLLTQISIHKRPSQIYNFSQKLSLEQLARHAAHRYLASQPSARALKNRKFWRRLLVFLVAATLVGSVLFSIFFCWFDSRS